MTVDTTIESAWPRYPGYRIDLVPLEGIGRVRVGGRLVAESSGCLLVRESDHHDQLYFPVDDVLTDLIDSDHTTVCPFKGLASHWSVEGGDGVEADVVWGYLDPMDEVAGIEGFVAFYHHRVEVTVSTPFDDGTEATATFPVWGTAADLVGLMDVTEVEPAGDARVFRAPTYPDPPLATFFDWATKLRTRNVVEGGQLLGAAITAAARTRPDLRVTTANIVFTKAASFDAPIDFVVDTRRDGRTLGAFDVRALQDDVLRASALIVGDKGADDVVRTVVPMPDVPGPGECPAEDFGVIGRDYRDVGGAYRDEDVAGPPVLHVWTRWSDDPGPEYLHQACLAQASTHWAIAAALKPHPHLTQDEAHVTVSMGPTAVSMAFHDEVDATQWHLTETQGIYAGRGSIQAQSRTWSVDGRLIASSTVQAIVRAFDRPIEAMGHDSTTAM